METEVRVEYPPARWRLLVETAPRTGAENMAIDEAIMEAVARREAPPTLRFYAWEPPCLSLGRRQPLESVDAARCARDGVETVRRPTGGLAILHTDELTYSLAALPEDPRASGAILDAYRKLSRGLVEGLRLLGVPAQMNPATPYATPTASAACFEMPSAYEIVAGEQKLLGSAQVRPQGRVLQHGSLPLCGDIARVTSYLALDSEEERQRLAAHLRARATTLEDVLGRPVPFAEAVAAMAEGFARALALDLVPAPLTEAETAAAQALAREKRRADPAYAAGASSEAVR